MDPEYQAALKIGESQDCEHWLDMRGNFLSTRHVARLLENLRNDPQQTQKPIDVDIDIG